MSQARPKGENAAATDPPATTLRLSEPLDGQRARPAAVASGTSFNLPVPQS